MKKITFPLLLLFFVSLSLYAQEPKPKRPGHFGLSFAGIALVQDQWGNFNRYDGGGTYGNGYYSEKLFYTIGFNYLKPIGSWLDIETGLEYSRKLGETKYIFLGDEVIKKANSTMASIPLTLRANFYKYFFVNGGLLADFDLGAYDSEFFGTERYQSGLGYVAGVGVKYGFKYEGQLYLNPYIKRRAIKAFSENEDHLKVNEAGIRIGVYFNTKGKSE